MHKRVFILLLLLSVTFASYSVGQEVLLTDQQINLNICNGYEPNQETDGNMNLYDYNGDYNGGQYYVTHIDMAASW